MKEYTYVMIKPDVSSNKHVVTAIKMILERNGLEIVVSRENPGNEMGYMMLDDKILEEHYGHVKKYGMNIYNSLVGFMKSGPVIPMVLYGENAIENTRKIVGCTDSTKADVGTIRRVFGTNKQRNAIHASDSKESVEAEVARFFDGMTIEHLDEVTNVKVKKLK